jgi:hypothetical protein
MFDVRFFDVRFSFFDVRKTKIEKRTSNIDTNEHRNYPLPFTAAGLSILVRP